MKRKQETRVLEGRVKSGKTGELQGELHGVLRGVQRVMGQSEMISTVKVRSGASTASPSGLCFRSESWMVQQHFEHLKSILEVLAPPVPECSLGLSPAYSLSALFSGCVLPLPADCCVPCPLHLIHPVHLTLSLLLETPGCKAVHTSSTPVVVGIW